MYCYEVTASLDDTLKPAYESYMLAKHLADVVETGCFVFAAFRPKGSGYVSAYFAPDKATLDRYLEKFSSSLREDFLFNFPSGVTLSRDAYETGSQEPPSA